MSVFDALGSLGGTDPNDPLAALLRALSGMGGQGDMGLPGPQPAAAGSTGFGGGFSFDPNPTTPPQGGAGGVFDRLGIPALPTGALTPASAQPATIGSPVTPPTPRPAPVTPPSVTTPPAATPAPAGGSQMRRGATTTDPNAAFAEPLHIAPDGSNLTPLPELTHTTIRPPTFRERVSEFGDRMSTPAFGDMAPMDLLALSARLADAAHDRWGTGPGSGAMAADAISESFGGAHTRRLQNEDADFIRHQRDRSRTTEGREDADYNRQQAHLQSLDQWLASLPPDQRAAAAADPEGALAAFREQQAHERTAFTDAGPGAVYNPMTGEFRIYDAEARDMGRRLTQAQIDHERTSAHDPLATATGRIDANRLEGYQTAAVNAETNVIPMLATLRQRLLGAAHSMGQPLDAAQRVRIDRLFGRNAEGRAQLESLNAQVIPMAIAATAGLRPVSNFEFEQALRTIPNPDMTLGGALERLDAMETEARRVVALGQHAEDYYRDHHSLTRVRDGDPSFVDSLDGFTGNAGPVDAHDLPDAHGWRRDPQGRPIPFLGDDGRTYTLGNDGQPRRLNSTEIQSATQPAPAAGGGQGAGGGFMGLGDVDHQAHELTQHIVRYFQPQEGDTRQRTGREGQGTYRFHNGHWVLVQGARH